MDKKSKGLPLAEDVEWFKRMMGDIKLHKHTKVPLQKPKKSQLTQRLIDKEPIENLFSDYERIEAVASNDFIEFMHSGLPIKKMRQLKKGHYAIEGILDLHGKTSLEASESLSQFLIQCRKKELRHILIIHGKGRDDPSPILKNKLNNWLRQSDDVLAFCSATPRHGGSGALYVLLRRKI